MTHLTDLELVDELDGVLPPARTAHLQSCPACRSRASTLRTSIADLRRSPADVPEPSPLFWDHFSQRVREAVSDLRQPATFSWYRSPLQWATFAAVALVAVAALFRATGPRTEMPPPPEAAALEQPSKPDDLSVRLEDDEEWGLVRVTAEDLGWEEAREAGLGPHPGAADGVALEMSAEERQELAQLLEDEIKRTGV